MNAVAALHRQPRSSLSEASQQAAEGQAEPQLWARQATGEGQHWKKWRLILRNLAFDVRPPCMPPRSAASCCRVHTQLATSSPASKDAPCTHGKPPLLQSGYPACDQQPTSKEGPCMHGSPSSLSTRSKISGCC